MVENKVEHDGEDDDATREAQLMKCGNLVPNTDTNDSICNSSTSANKNNNNNNNNNNDGTEKVTNTETNTVTTNNERNNGDVAEAKAETDAEAEAEVETNSANSNSSNNGIGRSNNKSYYVETKILNRPDDENNNKNKITRNNIGYDGENVGETREPQHKNTEIRRPQQTINDNAKIENSAAAQVLIKITIVMERRK